MHLLQPRRSDHRPRPAVAQNTTGTSASDVSIRIDNRTHITEPRVTGADGSAVLLVYLDSEPTDGTRRRTVRIAREPAIKNIEIDPKRDFPDVDEAIRRGPANLDACLAF